MTANPFEHVALINRSVREIFRVLTPERAKRFADEFVLSAEEAENIWQKPIVGCGHLVRRIAKHFQLTRLAVIVDYNNTMEPPGRVTLTDRDHLFVEIKSNIRWPKPLAALLTHEVSHIFLHHWKIRFADTFENEVLTDTATAFLGFGATMLNGATETKQEGYTYTGWGTKRTFVVSSQTKHFGYINLAEFGYVLAKREAMLKRNCAEGLDDGAPLTAFKSGRELVLGERSKRPFVARPIHQRALGSLMGRRESPPKPGETIEFLCPNCAQILRIPEAWREMNVRCKTCDSQFTCYS